MKTLWQPHFGRRLLVAAILCSCAGIAAAKQTLPIGFSRCDIGLGVTPIAFTAADLTNDGSVDLAIIGSNGLLITLLGNAAAFQDGDCLHATTRASDTLLPIGPVAIAAGDVTGDAKVDLVIGGGAGAALLVGDGTGTFTTRDLHASSDVQAVVIADINGDGQPDLIAGNGASHSVTMFPGQVGGLGSEVTIGSDGANAPDGPIDLLAVADFNTDGLPDVAAASTVRNSIWVLLQQRTTPATFVTQKYTMQPPQPPSALTVGFFDNDLFPDLAVTTVGPDALIVLQNHINEQPLFSPLSTGTGAAPRAVAANNPCDQCRDPVYLAVANHDDSTVSFFTTDTSGNPSEATPTCLAGGVPAACTTDLGPRAIVLADADGDNRSDVITANQTGQSMTVLLSSMPPVPFTPTPPETAPPTPTTTPTPTPGGDCCTAHVGPHCDNSACDACVSSLLPTCDSDTWDARCASLANGIEDQTCGAVCACGVLTATPTNTPIFTETPTPLDTATPTPTGPSPTVTLVPTLTPTQTRTPTITPTPVPFFSPTETPTVVQCVGSFCVQGNSCALDVDRGAPASTMVWLLPPALIWLIRRWRWGS